MTGLEPLDLPTLQTLLDRVAGVSVACVGDLMLDRYVYGEVTRISPEAPIPVLARRSEMLMLGAAGNVARNVAALGGTAHLAGEIGDDGDGEALLALIDAEAGVRPFIVRTPHSRTTVKTRFVAAGQQLLRVDLDRERAQADGVAPEVVASVRGARAVLVSDYAKGLVSDEAVAGCLTAARATGAIVIVDPKGADFARYGAVDLIKPNAAELALATGWPTRTDAEVEAALAAALDRCMVGAVLVTRAAAGMSWMERGGPVRHIHGRAREVFDVSGAGDTSLAALGLALGAGASLEQAVFFAVAASGVVVGKAGTAVVTPLELIEAELSVHAAVGAAKIAAPDRAARAAAAWRAQGLRVGFTNGCFDILHRGHVAYLGQARAWCDRLIVGLNTDSSVRALKGPGRPVNDLESRALVLAALGSVDLVAPFDAPTPIALIEAVRPDVLVKGADYTVEQVVGADLVQSWGGEVKLAPLLEGHSTTAAIARMTGAGR